MKYIRIKDWEKHQHYKDRNPPWIKLHNKLLTHYEFSQLSDSGKLQIILLWLLASQTQNKIPADPAWIKDNIKCKSKVDLKTLETLDFIELYQDASKCVQNACLETETEAEKERETEEAFRWDDIILHWNSIASKHGFAEVKRMTESRKTHYKARCKQAGGQDEYWRIVDAEFNRLGDFAKGKNDRGWKISFDFIVESEDKFAKLSEGKYRATGNQSSSSESRWISPGGEGVVD